MGKARPTRTKATAMTATCTILAILFWITIAGMCAVANLEVPRRG